MLLCTLIGGSCVGYVLQKNKIYELGQQIGARHLPRRGHADAVDAVEDLERGGMNLIRNQKLEVLFQRISRIR